MVGVAGQSGLQGHCGAGRGVRGEKAEPSPRPCLAAQRQHLVPAPQVQGLLPSPTTAFTHCTSFCYLPSSLGSLFLPSRSRHLSQASLPPAQASRVASGHAPASQISPSFGSGHPRLRPLAPATHARALPRPWSHLLPRSAGTLRARPAPGRPAALPALPPALAPARVPPARPPLTACFREPGRPLAAAMMAPSRDGGAAFKPRPCSASSRDSATPPNAGGAKTGGGGSRGFCSWFTPIRGLPVTLSSSTPGYLPSPLEIKTHFQSLPPCRGLRSAAVPKTMPGVPQNRGFDLLKEHCHPKPRRASRFSLLPQ